jgi:oligoendopeptidase F
MAQLSTIILTPSGLLFALGLYALYQKEPDVFRAQYDDFLSRCGMADAKTLAQTFGIDTTDRAFWRSESGCHSRSN